MDSKQILLADHNPHDKNQAELPCAGEWVWGLFKVDALSAITALVKGNPNRSRRLFSKTRARRQVVVTIRQGHEFVGH